MFSHIMLGGDDLDAAKRFYDATIGALGGSEGQFDPLGRLIYMHNGGLFIVTTPINGQPASCANGSTIGFAADSPEMVDAWHRAGVDNGGTSIENPPGVREANGRKLYLAYLRDPDGNKLCAVHRMG
ncbi:MAG: VOC family protein [Porphyrobacter sp.]|nr:VOC family protein [Porphyrobacter sp.]